MSTQERLLLVTQLLSQVMKDESSRLTMVEIGFLTEARRDVVLAGRHLGVEVSAP